MSEIHQGLRFEPSRRGFLKGSALAVGASALPLSAARAATRGGTLRYGVAHGSTTDSLDPGSFENDFMIALSHTCNAFLVEVDSNSEVVPELATGWEAQDGAAKWVFELRNDVEFHNGKSLTADDVIASLNHHRAADSTSAAKPNLESINEIRADGPHTVVFELSGGNVDFPYTVADYHLPIRPSVDGAMDPNSGVGAGAYVLEDFEPGVRMGASRFANYFKSDRGHFEEVMMLAIVDPAARTNALRSGDVDLIGRVDLKTVHLLARDRNIDIKSVAGSQHYTFPMRTDTPPFDDNHVRMALKLSIKRDEIVDKILKGYGTVGNDHPISPAGVFFNADLPMREYDPDQAKWHLQQAGLSSLSVQLSAADAAFAGSVDAASLYAESAKAAGIEIEVVREPNDGYWSNVWLAKPWCACYWGGRVVPNEMFTVAYSAGAAWNDTYWEHERFNMLLIEGRGELDPAKRAEIYGEMQQIVRDEGGVVVPMFANYVFAARKNVMHDKLAANWDIDGQRFAERWWFG